MKRNSRTRIIGLTGGIGCGKSLVMDILKKEYDVLALVADDIGRMAMEKGTKTYEEMVTCFGRDILDEDGTINRGRIAEIIFSDDVMRKKQNDIIHPFVRNQIVQAIEHTKKPLSVIESAILVQAGYEDVCDEIWVVLSDEAIRRRRLKVSRGYTDERIDAIMKNQWKESEYLKHCDRVIHNNGDENQVREQILMQKPQAGRLLWR